MNPQHLSKSAEWFTGYELLLRSLKVLGEVDLDPASCLSANERVGARTFFDTEQNGLNQDWYKYAGKVLINPPGDRRGRLVKAFWDKLRSYDGQLTSAIWIGFSLEQLRYLPNLGDATIVIPRKRPVYLKPDGSEARSPTHGGYVAYLDFRANSEHGKFVNAFQDIANILWLGTSDPSCP